VTSVFPLIPRRRVLGLPFGGLHSLRRGPGSDVAGSRPYEPGDDVDKIDWYASARLSLARGSEEFVVREHFADEAPRVVVLCDRRPSMSIFGGDWPWLRKPDAVGHALKMIGDSAIAARGLLGYLDEAEGEPFWRPPRTERELDRLVADRSFHAPEDTVPRGLAYLAKQRRDLPAGTFLFVLSDFLAAPSRDDWLWALERRWEIVPVVLQDPVWERTFPDVSGVVVPYAHAGNGRVELVRLTEREVAERREANEARWGELIDRLRALDLDPVLVASHEPRDVSFAFLSWADQRLFTRGRA
jgi:uncharacterized protein (DUF58 family)